VATPRDARRRRFRAVCALCFVGSAALTIAWGAAMPGHCALAMPGGWTLSAMWMRMPGQSWPGAAASFVAMWLAMTAAMMLPSLVPMLERYRSAVAGTAAARLGRLTALVAAGYFLVWTAVGLAVFPLGAALAALALADPALARAVPLAIGVLVVGAGALQLTAWTARHLACCRAGLHDGRPLPADPGAAGRHGLRLGVHCVASCAALTAVLLLVGVMDLRAMGVVTTAITAQRLAPEGGRVARAVGAITLAAGAVLIARAAWLS
jgi:predicted metal-binding membrane protein